MSPEATLGLRKTPFGRAAPQVVLGLDLDGSHLTQWRNQTRLGQDVKGASLVGGEVEVGGWAQQNADHAIATTDAACRTPVAVDPPTIVAAMPLAVVSAHVTTVTGASDIFGPPTDTPYEISCPQTCRGG